MPKLSVAVPHELGKEEATSRVKGFAEKLNERYQDQAKDLEHAWEDDTLSFSFRTMGMNFKGAIAVAEDAVNIDGDLPFAAMMFKGKIESSCREELTKLLSRSDADPS